MKNLRSRTCLYCCLMGVMAISSCVQFESNRIGNQTYLQALKLRDDGKYARADRELQALVKGRTSVFGADAPETLEVRLARAGLLTYTPRNAEAEMQLRALLPVLERVFGAEHEKTLICHVHSVRLYKARVNTLKRSLGFADGYLFS